jgi:hypothetical protein
MLSIDVAPYADGCGCVSLDLSSTVTLCCVRNDGPMQPFKGTIQAVWVGQLRRCVRPRACAITSICARLGPPPDRPVGSHGKRPLSRQPADVLHKTPGMDALGLLA